MTGFAIGVGIAALKGTLRRLRTGRDHGIYLTAVEEIARRYGHPVIIGRVFVADIDRNKVVAVAARRQRRPDDVALLAPPADPGRRPPRAWHPVPADFIGIAPAAIVIGRPAKRLVRDVRDVSRDTIRNAGREESRKGTGGAGFAQSKFSFPASCLPDYVS